MVFRCRMHESAFAQSGFSERLAVMSAFGSKADMGHRMVPIISAAFDPKRTFVGSKSRSAAMPRCAIPSFRSTGATSQ
jgi:hypothetical protein